MSQKPRTGAQNRAAPVARAAAKEASAKTAPTRPPEVVKAETMPAVERAIEPETEVVPLPTASEPVVADVVSTAAAASEVVAEAAPELVAPEPAAAVAEPIKAAMDSIANVTVAAAKPVAAIKPTNPTLTQGMKTMMKSTEDFVAFGQANLEAFVKSGQIWSAGMQELTKQIATSAKASFDESVSTFKAISTAKSVKEAMDLQSTFAKATLEKAMAESNKLTDASIKLTEQTLAPITARVTMAVESFGKSV